MAEKTIQYQELLKVVRNMKGEDQLFYFFLSACENSSLQICQICLDAGANINIYEHYHRETLLKKLVDNGTFTTKVGDWLIEKGADINITGYSSSTNLSLACLKGNLDIAKYFIDKGIIIKQYKNDKESESDLYCAVDGGNYEIVKMLLDLGVDLECDIQPVFNPLYLAVEYRKSNIVELFLQKGASPNFYAYDMTFLHMAVAKKDMQTARILLKYNADVNAKLNEDARFIEDSFAITPMDIAVLNHDIDMQKLLLNFDGVVSSKEEKLQALMECENSEEVSLMMKKVLAS